MTSPEQAFRKCPLNVLIQNLPSTLARPQPGPWSSRPDYEIQPLPCRWLTPTGRHCSLWTRRKQQIQGLMTLWVCVSFSPSALQDLLLITPWDPKTSHKNDTMCYSDYETEVSSCFAVASALGQNLNTGIRWQRKKHQRFHFTEEKCMWSMGSQPPKGAHRSHVERFHVVLKTETVHGGSL